jgi:hypothetical protein
MCKCKYCFMCKQFFPLFSGSESCLRPVREHLSHRRQPHFRDDLRVAAYRGAKGNCRLISSHPSPLFAHVLRPTGEQKATVALYLPILHRCSLTCCGLPGNKRQQPPNIFPSFPAVRLRVAAYRGTKGNSRLISSHLSPLFAYELRPTGEQKATVA